MIFSKPARKIISYTFTAAGNRTMDEGPTKCNAGDPQTQSIYLEFSDSETMFIFPPPLFTGWQQYFTLVSVTETQLVLSIILITLLGPTSF